MASALAGLGSSIDVNTLVSSLMAVERAPVDALSTKTQQYQLDISAYGSVSSVLSNLQTAARGLTDPTVTKGATATSSSTSVGVQAGAGALPGVYSVQVKSLAQTHRINSEAFAGTDTVLGGGTLTIELGSYKNGAFTAASGSSPVSITIDPAKSTLTDVRSAINNANAGVTASIVNDGSGQRLVLTSGQSGASGSMRLSVTDADGDNADAAGLSRLAYDPAGSAGSGRNMSQTSAAQDAELVVDGLTITRTSNTVSDVIDNLTLTLNDTGTSKIAVARDQSSSKAAIDKFVKSFNDANSTIRNLVAYDATTKKGGTLAGETVPKAALARLRGQLGNAFGSATSAYRTLSSLGISFQKDGTLSATSSTFEKAVAADPKGVASMLEAFGAAVNSTLSDVLGVDGAITARTSGIQTTIERTKARQTQMEARLTTVEARYRKQFSALDTSLSSMTQTLNYLKSQFSSGSSSA